MPSLRVIIVNFNAGETLLACVEAVLAYPGQVSVTVVDNASLDGSVAALRERFGDQPRLEVHCNEENLGFARAVNQVARRADETYVLVLNPDCVLRPGAIDALVDALELDPGAGVAGPWVTDPSGRVQKGTWRRFPDPRRSLMSVTGLHRLSNRSPALAGVDKRGHEAPDAPTRAEAVSGACMMLRRSAVESVGWFDAAYAMHCEDLDLMYRLAERGYHCIVVPDAKAVHYGGISSATRPWWVHRQKHIGMLRYFRKFQAADQAAPVRWLVYAGIWCHYLLTLPVVLIKSIAKAA